MNLLWCAVLALGSAAPDDDEPRKSPGPAGTVELEALRDLAGRVLKLEERQQEADKDKPKAPPPPPEKPPGQTWDAAKMLSFSSPDGNFTAKIGGRIYFVYRHIFDATGSAAPPAGGAKDSFLIDSARFQLDGTFYKDFFYRVEGEAKSGETANGGTGTNNVLPASFRTKDVYLGWSGLGDWLTVQAGQFKAPISQEETCSSRFIDFAERSVLNRIVPGHVQGVQARGALFDRTVEWWLGVMNGAASRDSDRGFADGNDEKDLFFRIFLTPLKTVDVELFRQTRFGFDYSRGKRDRATVAPPDVSSGDLGLPLLLDYAGLGTLNGFQTRQVLNFSWIYGPASVRAEYLRNRMDVDGVAGNSFLQRAFYVSASVLLTGEPKPLENRIKPRNIFSPLDGRWGAWELAARWARIDGISGRHAGVITVGNTGATEYTFGLNWWMTPNIAVRIDWERLIYDVPIPTGTGGATKRSEDLIYVRWQIDF